MTGALGPGTRAQGLRCRRQQCFVRIRAERRCCTGRSSTVYASHASHLASSLGACQERFLFQKIAFLVRRTAFTGATYLMIGLLPYLEHGRK